MYDVLIVGGGPAGISAAIYAKRAGKSVAIIEKFALGGEINLIGKIENYLGFSCIDGPEMAAEFSRHAKALGIETIYAEVKDYDLSGAVKKVICRKASYECHSLVLALGCHSRPLGIEGEDKFSGRGVSYCAVCDGNFFKGKRVVVVGSGDTAVSDAMYLSGLCQKVSLVCDQLKLISHNKTDLKGIEVIDGVEAKQIKGKDSVEGLVISQNGKTRTIKTDAVFIAVGRTPETGNLRGKIRLDKNGYIKTNAKMQTSAEGVYACGDVREGSLKQISTAVGDGAVAGTEASKHAALQMFKK